MSASRIATSDTSGRSSPSRRRLTPTSTSYSPSRRSRMIWIRSSVSISRVEVARLDARLEQVVGQVLGHLLRQRRDEHALAPLLAAADLVQQVVDLVPRRPQLDLGVDDAGRPDQLLGDARRVAQLPRAGRRRDEHELRAPSRGTRRSAAAGCRAPTAAGSRSRRASACASGRPRTCRRSAGPSGATRRRRRRSRTGSSRAACAAPSPAGGRRGSASSSRSRCRTRAPASSRGRTRCAAGSGAPRASGPPSRTSSPAPASSCLISTTARSIVGFEVTYCVAGKTVIVSSRDSTSPVSGSKCVIASTSSPKNETRYAVSAVRRLDLEHVALDPEAPAAEQRVVADVLDVDQLAQHEVAVVLLADREEDDLLLVLLRRAEAVDARDRGDDDRRRAARAGSTSPRGAAGRCRRSASCPSRCRGRPGGRTPRAGSSRSTRRSTRPRCRGKNSRNSLQSCAASVLLCAITSAGRWTFSMIQAIVAVLPVPVAPSSVW